MPRACANSMALMTCRLNAIKRVNPDHLVEITGFVLTHTGFGQGLKERYRHIMNLATHDEALATELILTRCERDAAGIHGLDEHWNGNGRPERLQGTAIPLESRIALLAQVADVFHSIGGHARAVQEVHERRGTWFDPAVVAAFDAACARAGFWRRCPRPIGRRVYAPSSPSRAHS